MQLELPKYSRKHEIFQHYAWLFHGA